MVAVSSWGRLSRTDHVVVPIGDRNQAAGLIQASRPGIPRGMGRSYGDVCLNQVGVLWATAGLDRFISFDAETGRLVCEAGVLLRDIQRLAIPQGWMLPVSPGTQMVSVGGAIANDVHGKNHHVAGSFGDHVRQMTLLRTDGEIIECGPDLRAEWFAATLGGIGLTGFILTAEIQLRRVPGPWLATETLPYADLGEFFELAAQSEAGWEYTVSWIDCLSGATGRGLFMRGNHVVVDDRVVTAKRPGRIPATPPFSLVNKLTLHALNTAYYQLGKWRSAASTVHYEPFFYPLDNLAEWNRIYGPRGFYQYQCVIPGDGRPVVQAMLKEIARSGSGSFLAVLKTFGNRMSVGMLGFPRPGVTLALDFPNLGERTEQLLQRLDAIVAEARGRIYLAKDARMPRQLFESGYERYAEFRQYRDPGISSDMSRRLMGS